MTDNPLAENTSEELSADIVATTIGVDVEEVNDFIHHETDLSFNDDPETADILEAFDFITSDIFQPDPLLALDEILTTRVADPAGAALEAAEAGGIEVRLAETYLDIAAAVQVLDATFGEDDGHYYPPSLLRNIIAAGACVYIAWDEETPVGTILSIPGWGERGLMIQSGPMAVSPTVRGRGVSKALKYAQLAWCLERGIPEVRWTFDLMNKTLAKLNFHSLGVEVAEFLPGFVGVRSADADSSMVPNDRLAVRWDLTSITEPTLIPANQERFWAVKSVKGQPVVNPKWKEANVIYIELPEIQGLRANNPELAALWQQRVGETLQEIINCGWRLGVSSGGHYRAISPTNDKNQKESII